MNLLQRIIDKLLGVTPPEEAPASQFSHPPRPQEKPSYPPPTPIPRRPLTEQEMGWVQEILAAHPLWRDVQPGELFAVLKCGCGCRSINFEETSEPQNPRAGNAVGPIGSVYIRTTDKSELRNLIHVTLFQRDGYLTWLDVIWYDFDNPMPASWEEVEHTVHADIW